ncbi:MAG: class I SAM-dependent methyltransferase [Candidatus Methanomethylophilus sp.]|nr:class I SAM-dependent methyltransferase [Methanomethylophilus sp.]
MKEQDDTQLKIIGGYWSQRSAGFSEYAMEHLDEDRRGLYFRRIKAFATGRRLTVLDIGCGPGIFSVVLGRDGHQVTGIDYSDGMIDQARKNCRQAGVPADIRKMDAHHLMFPDASFDLIVSRRVVWNLEDPVQAYREWLRVLRPNGRMILFDGNYFLSMHDKEYRQNLEKFQRNHPQEDLTPEQQAKLNQGADPTIRDQFAKKLPLSFLRRPAWDTGILLELGAASVCAETDTSAPAPDGSGRLLPQTFVLTVLKQIE